MVKYNWKKNYTKEKHPMFGKKHKLESINKMSKTKLKLYSNPKNHPRWKGGRIRYYHNEAKKIVENLIGRKLNKYECIHHLDGNWRNNNIDNLIIFPNSAEHTIYHRFLRDCVKEILKGEENSL